MSFNFGTPKTTGQSSMFSMSTPANTTSKNIVKKKQKINRYTNVKLIYFSLHLKSKIVDSSKLYAF